MFPEIKQTQTYFPVSESNLWEKGIDVIVESGNYASREAVLQEAFILFLSAHPKMRLIIAIQLYQAKVVTLARAAELADLNFFDFQAILRARGIDIHSLDESSDEIDLGVALILGAE